MLTYIHAQAEPLYRDILTRMLQVGQYHFVPVLQAYEMHEQNPNVGYA